MEESKHFFYKNTKLNLIIALKRIHFIIKNNSVWIYLWKIYDSNSFLDLKWKKITRKIGGFLLKIGISRFKSGNGRPMHIAMRCEIFSPLLLTVIFQCNGMLLFLRVYQNTRVLELFLFFSSNLDILFYGRENKCSKILFIYDFLTLKNRGAFLIKFN